MGEYDDDARRFDAKVPPERRAQTDIRSWLDDNMGLPDGFMDELAPRIADRRDAAPEVPIDSRSEAVYLPDMGAWKDPETGRFIGKDDL